MTHPISDTSTAASQPKAESFLDWFHINSRWITIGAIVVAVIAFGVWFVQRKNLNESISADRQLVVAKQSLQSGNLPLAEADLKKVVDKYPDRAAGSEAGLLLAQLKIERADYAGAVTGLRDLATKVSSGPNAAAVRGLLGDALAQLDKAADAAVEYEKAAGVTTMPNEKSYWQAKAARAYLTAGKTPEARKLFEVLAVQTENEAISTEAHVRLGELAVAGKR
ncbi:MAG: tetratricopeptide repeat protein [Gemmatimonadaceae bacterium]